MRNHLIVFLFLILPMAVCAQPAGYGFGKAITISNAQVSGSGNLTDFPVLISLTDNDLRTTANGGNVTNANGFDIIFTLANCSTVLSHQIERYNATTGEFIAWVKIPTLSGSSDTRIHMYYGNASVTTDPSLTNTWNSNFVSRYHLNQDPTVANRDYTANANNGTHSNMESADLVAGKIGLALNFDGSNERINLPNTNNPGSNFTITCWIRSNQSDAGFHGIIGSDNNTGCCMNRSAGLWVQSSTRIHGGFGDGTSWCSWSSATGSISNGTGTWNHIAYTYNNTQQSLWVDGVNIFNSTICAPNNPVDNRIEFIGMRDNFFRGDIDEVGISNVVRSNDWIITEFNNQNNPSAFYTVSAQFTASLLCITLPIELLSFTATEADSDVNLNWITATEQHNERFELERSQNGLDWATIHEQAGAGNSAVPSYYAYTDENVPSGILYYRLRQIDFNGDFSYSPIVSVRSHEETNQPFVYPNPSNGMVQVKSMSGDLKNLVLMDVFGKIILDQTHFVITADGQIRFTIEHLSKGMYFLKSDKQSLAIIRS